MASEKDLLEIRTRDFLKNVDHYKDADDVQTELIFGSRPEEPLFLTIIVPVYDHPIEFIRRAISSALNQPCSYDFQLLVIDDYANREGPSDTELYLRQKNDPRVVYYKNKKNLGVFDNWNRAIMLSNSQWITFLHSDDFLQDHLLENMGRIVREHPEIDQLCCNYELLDFLHTQPDPQKEYKGIGGTKTVTRLNSSQYWYHFPTSVKGAFYKREKLLEIGGFRGQGRALGLDDYPLMLRFAHHYNTYLIDDVLYKNSWGYNDSLNLKHWYPQLIADYYMWLDLAKRECFLLRPLFRIRARHLLSKRAKEFNDGTSWVGVPVPIDFEQLKQDCRVKSLKVNPLAEFFIRKSVNFIMRCKRANPIQFQTEIIPTEQPCTLD